MSVSMLTICMVRGCGNLAEYFMRVPRSRGGFTVGLVCDTCEVRLGNINEEKVAEYSIDRVILP